MTYKEWIIGQHLTRTTKESFYRFYDRHGFNKIVRANYFSPHGIPLDNQAEDIAEISGLNIEINDLVDFILTYLRNPFCRKSWPDYEGM